MTPLLAIGRSDAARLGTGLFIVLGLGLLSIWVAVHFGQGRLIHFTCRDDVSGLRQGTPVLIAGYTVGAVRRIEAHPAGTDAGACAGAQRTRFRLVLALERQWTLPTGTTVRIVRPNLITPALQLQLGPVEATAHAQQVPLPWAEDATVDWAARFEKLIDEDLVTILNQTLQLLSTAQAGLDEGRKTLAEMRQITQALAHRQARGSDPLVVRDLQRSLAALATSSEALPQQLTAIEAGFVEALTSIQAQAEDLALARRSGEVAQILKQLNAATTHLVPILSEADHVARQLRETLPILLAGLARSARELAEFLIDLRSHPAAALGGQRRPEAGWTGDERR